MAVTVEGGLCLFIFCRQIKSAWWCKVPALAVTCWIGGKKAETVLKTVDASVLWKHPHSALQQSVIFRLCHSQEGSECDCHQSHPHRGVDVMLDVQEQEMMGCLRSSQSILGLLLTQWHVCRPTGAIWDTSGHPQHPFLVIPGQLL